MLNEEDRQKILGTTTSSFRLIREEWTSYPSTLDMQIEVSEVELPCPIFCEWVLPWPEGDKTPQKADIRKSVVNLMSEDS